MEANTFSLFKGYADTLPADATLSEIIRMIRQDPTVKLHTLKHRYYASQGNAAAADKEKSSCPCFSVAVRFQGGKRKRHICGWTSVGLVDIDHLASSAEAAAWRDRLADDPLLRPDLAFVSPSGTGVKLFLSYRLAPDDVLAEAFGRAMRAAWDYLELTYGLQPDQANKDLCRACLLAHDADARIRQPEGQQG